MNRHTLCKLLPTLLIALTFLTTKADAGLVISFGPGNGLAGGPVSLVEGQAGKLNVFIQRDSDANTPALDSFTVQLSLSPVGTSPANGLLFAPTDSQQQLQLSSDNYVLFNNSLATNNNLRVGTVTESRLGFTGSDTAVTAGFVPQSNRLLFSLDLNPISQGDYRISAIATPNSFVSLDSNFNSVSIPFSSTPSTITVTAVPEPSSIALLIASIGAAALPARRRKRLNQK